MSENNFITNKVWATILFIFALFLLSCLILGTIYILNSYSRQQPLLDIERGATVKGVYITNTIYYGEEFIKGRANTSDKALEVAENKIPALKSTALKDMNVL
ncbi:MAG: hypothetical protein ACRC42_01595 [Mycoplasma sp.]